MRRSPPRIKSRFFFQVAVEGSGLGVLAGTSPLQHFFWGVVGGWEPALLPPVHEALHPFFFFAGTHEFTWQGENRGCKDPRITRVLLGEGGCYGDKGAVYPSITERNYAQCGESHVHVVMSVSG